MRKNVKPSFFFGGCNFRKGKYLTICGASNSQCGGQGFDPPLLHQKLTILQNLTVRYSTWSKMPAGQYLATITAHNIKEL